MVYLIRNAAIVVALVLAALVSQGSSGIFKEVFLLGGQSNMAGRGGVMNGSWDKFVPQECRSSPSIFSLTRDLRWVEAVEPIGKEMDPICGIGPGMPFAHVFLQHAAASLPFVEEVGLVPCAVGGTNISQWSRGSFLYDQMVVRARAAMLDGGMIRALLWYQGESDTHSKEMAEAYHDKLAKFFTDFRSDIVFPLLPIIQVVLVSADDFTYMDVVRCAQLAVCSELPNVRCVDARTLNVTLNTDKLHLNTESQVKLGEAIFNVFLNHFFPPNI